MSAPCPTCGEPLARGLCPRCAATVLWREEDSTVHDGPSAGGAFVRPTTLGPYELVEEIARGGMGVVYRARQPSLGREVAVKVILAGPFAGAASLARFRAEAEAVARLHHPNLVAVHDFGETGGHHWLLMDYVAGPTLAALTRDGPLPPRTAARHVRDVAAAVQHAHDHGVLHRDLKPGNVLVDAEDRPRVTDFGLVKRLDRDDSPTLSGQLLGTPGFAPPEQLAPRLGPVTVRSDVYGLGALLYHLLTGRPPFQAGSVPETIGQVLHAEPAPPRALNPAVPRDLETICLKCVAKELGRRYATAREVERELACWLAGEPITARPTPAWERLWLWCRRRPAVAVPSLVGGLALLILAVGTPLVALRLQRAELADKERDLARAHADLRQQESKIADAQARRASLESGRRFGSLAALAAAAAIEPTPRIRDEVITTLAAPDIQVWRTLNTNGSPLLRPVLDRTGLMMAGATTNGDVQVVAVSDGQELHRLPPVASDVVMVHAFSPDGALLPVTYADGRTRIWSLPEREVKLSYAGSPRFETVDYSADGRTLATVVDGTNVVIRSRPDLQVKAILPVSFVASYVSLSPDGGRLAISAFNYRQVELFETAGTHLGGMVYPYAAGEPAWHPDGCLLAVATSGGFVHLWDSGSQQMVKTLKGHQGSVGNVVFSPDGRHLLSSGWDGTLLWETVSGRCVARLGSVVARLKFSPDGQMVMGAAWEKDRIHLCRFSAAPEVRHFPVVEHAGEIGDFALHPRLGLIAATLGNAVWLLDSQTGRRLGRLPTRQSWGVCFDRDGSRLLVSGDFGVQVWPVRLEAGAVPLLGPPRSLLAESGCRELSLSGDGRVLAVGHGKHVHLVDLDAERQVAVTEDHPSEHIHRTALSADGRRLATSGWHSPEVGLWDAGTGKLETYLGLPGNDGHGVPCFDPQGRWLALAFPGRLAFFAHRAGKLQRELPVGDAYGLASSARGDLLAVRDTTTSVALVNVESGEQVARLVGLEHLHVQRIKWERDDALLLMQTLDENLVGGVLLWNLARIRAHLAPLGLDWGLGPPTADAFAASPPAVRVNLPVGQEVAGETTVVSGRPEGMESRLIDLSGFYNATLDAPWNLYADSTYSQLPRGRQMIGGRLYDVRGIVQAGGFDPALRPYSRKVAGIPVGQAVEQLHFLHAANNGNDVGVGTRLGHYEVTYEDGRTLEIPIILGRDVNDWWSRTDESPVPRIAWSGTSPASAAARRKIRLFVSTWENPRPAVRVASLALVTADLTAVPFLVAVTAE
ncbi:MAG: WD40 repeat domain-containing serine/threonine-protein kinase [Limisphaerales bacterium]